MDRLAVTIALLLALAAGLTLRQLPTWESNVALWRAAVRLNAVSPRPAFNLGAAYQVAGDFPAAVIWYEAAWRRSIAGPEAARYQAAIRARLELLEHYGFFACDRSPFSPVCS